MKNEQKDVKNPETSIEENPMLIREAGQEVLGQPDKLLLGFIIARELIIDSMREAGIRPPVKADNDEADQIVYDAYQSICQRIDERKTEIGLSPPPSQE